MNLVWSRQFYRFVDLIDKDRTVQVDLSGHSLSYVHQFIVVVCVRFLLLLLNWYKANRSYLKEFCAAIVCSDIVCEL